MDTALDDGFPSQVLVVDDEPLVLKIFSKILPVRGIPLKTASSGDDALALLASERFGCVLTDKNMPGIDGLELMRQVRARQPHCACILMTAYASTQSAVEALRLGASDYLEKPFHDLDLVGQKVENAIKAHRTAFERDAFLERLRTFEAELEEKDRKVIHQKTEIEMFDQVLELRVRQATEDLHKKTAILEYALSSLQDEIYYPHANPVAISDSVDFMKPAVGNSTDKINRLREGRQSHGAENNL